MKKVYEKDVVIIKNALEDMPVNWDGKRSIIALKEANFQWKQMEWIGFYFEYLCQVRLKNAGFTIPGKRYGNVEFDSFSSINWDWKSSAIKSHNHKIILNDQLAMDSSLDTYGYHGLILSLLDVEYNDDSRTFQQWHSELKGGVSEYEKDRIRRNATSRYRKTSAKMNQILLLVIDKCNKDYLCIHKQGRNAGGQERNPKYMLDIETAHHFEVDRINF